MEYAKQVEVMLGQQRIFIVSSSARVVIGCLLSALRPWDKFTSLCSAEEHADHGRPSEVEGSHGTQRLLHYRRLGRRTPQNTVLS